MTDFRRVIFSNIKPRSYERKLKFARLDVAPQSREKNRTRTEQISDCVFVKGNSPSPCEVYTLAPKAHPPRAEKGELLGVLGVQALACKINSNEYQMRDDNWNLIYILTQSGA